MKPVKNTKLQQVLAIERSVLFIASFLCLFPVVRGKFCTPRPGYCCEDNNRYVNDTTVHPAAALNCSFDSSLCCYRQGCVDSDMTVWNLTEGYATVKQSTIDNGAGVYSVLESPWVNVSTPSCIEFTYNRAVPYQLDVFLAYNNGTQPSLVANSSYVGDQQNRTVLLSIMNLTGKIQFRIRGGGATSHEPSPRLFYIRITERLCQGNSANPDDVSDPSTCEDVTSTRPTTQTTTAQPISPYSTSLGTAATSQRPAVPTSSVFPFTSSSDPSASTTDSFVLPSASSASDTESSGDGSQNMPTGSLVAVVLSVLVVIAVVVVVVVWLVRRRQRLQKDHPSPGSDSGEMPGRSQYENQGFHQQPEQHSADDRSTPVPRETSDQRDSANYYLTPRNVYDGFTNRNVEQNHYDALANQSNVYDGLSPNRTEKRVYDSLAAPGRQNEDYEIPDTPGSHNAGVAEGRRASCEYYNQPALKKGGVLSSSQAATSSKLSDYQNV